MVKSAYNASYSSLPSWQWRCIWKSKLPPRLKSFMWLLLHGRLLTNVNWMHKHMTNDPTCSLCNRGIEDLDHTFRNCCYARQVWNHFALPLQLHKSFSLDFDNWLRINIKQTTTSVFGIPWYGLFIATLWFLWSWRCQAIFIPEFKRSQHPLFNIARYYYSLCT